MGDALYGVDISVLGAHRAVYIEGLQEIVFQRIHNIGRHLVATQDAVVVGLTALSLPRQANIVLLCLCFGVGQFYVVVKTILARISRLELYALSGS